MTTIARAMRDAESVRDRYAWVPEWLSGPSIAVMLYGSQARGERPDSDVDVLQVVEDRGRVYSVGEVNVSAYRAAHFRELASRGSLFVRHLRDEGVVLSDPDRVLQQILSEYLEPASYGALRAELAVVVSALTATGCRRPYIAPEPKRLASLAPVVNPFARLATAHGDRVLSTAECRTVWNRMTADRAY